MRRFVLIGFILLIISIIITLNIFFQQNYQREMAEQLNSQQVLIAKQEERRTGALGCCPEGSGLEHDGAAEGVDIGTQK
jgi:hypothetical protein